MKKNFLEKGQYRELGKALFFLMAAAIVSVPSARADVVSPFEQVYPIVTSLRTTQGVNWFTVRQLAPERIDRLSDGDKVAIRSSGYGWSNFEAPRFLRVVEADNGNLTVRNDGISPTDPGCTFVVMKDGMNLAFVYTTKKGEKRSLVAEGNVVGLSKTTVDTAQKDVNFDNQWWMLQAFKSYLGTESVVTKLANKKTTGFLIDRKDVSRQVTTASEEEFPATFGEGAMISICSLKTVTDSYKAGGKSYSYDPDIVSWWYPVFTDSWKLGRPGKGSIKFKAKARSDIRVYFSAVKDTDPETSLYCCSIGERNNAASAFREKIGSMASPDSAIVSDPAAYSIDKGQKPSVVIQNPEAQQDYWISVDGGKIAWGTGTKVGENTQMSWEDTTPLTDVQYVSFAGLTTPVFYDEIFFTPPPPEKPVINLPAGYVAYDAAGLVDKVSVGSSAKKDGDLAVWALKDGKILRFNKATKSFDPYTPQATSSTYNVTGSSIVSDIACGNDGSVYAIIDKTLYYLKKNDAGTAYEDNKWEQASSKVWSSERGIVVPGITFIPQAISVGSADNVWALLKDSTELYQLQSVEVAKTDGSKESILVWVKRADFAVKVSAALDGSAVVLDNQGFAYLYLGGKWVTIGAAREFSTFAAISKDYILGIGRDGILYEYKSATGADGIYVPGGWAAIMGSDTKPTNGFFALAANTVGTVFALDKIGSVYAKGEAGVSDALKTTVTGTADGVLVDPKAGATTAAGETVEGLLVKLKVIAELFKTTDDTTVSADDLTIIKQIGQQLSAFTPPAPKTATQPATPSDVAKSPDTPPTKEEQVDQQKDTKAGTPEPTPTISQPATGRGGRPTTNPRAAGASGLNRVNRITGSGAASSTRPGLSTRPTTTGQRPRPGASPRPGVQRPGATTSAGSATSQRPTRPSGSSASSARPSTVRPTASRPGTATRPGVQRPGASSSSTRPTGSRPTSRR